GGRTPRQAAPRCASRGGRRGPLASVSLMVATAGPACGGDGRARGLVGLPEDSPARPAAPSPAARMTGRGPRRHDRGMDLPIDLPGPLAWLVDEAGASPGPDRFLAELGGRLLADGLPLAGGALTLAVPHPIIARCTWLWRAQTGAVIEALGFAGGPLSQAGHDWLAELGPVQQDTIGPAPDSPVLAWAGTQPFGPAEAGRLRQAARFAAAPLATLAARAALAALLEA